MKVSDEFRDHDCRNPVAPGLWVSLWQRLRADDLQRPWSRPGPIMSSPEPGTKPLKRACKAPSCAELFRWRKSARDRR